LDIFTTALEGGIGYWSECTDYHWSNDDGTEDYDGFYATVTIPAELLDDVTLNSRVTKFADTYTTWNNQEAEGVGVRIDKSVIARGLRIGAQTAEKDNYYWQCGCGKPPLFLTEATCEEWDFDSLDADAIVQYGLFGKVVFG
jgi:hypothetical protein